jgi:hypothetical protein
MFIARDLTLSSLFPSMVRFNIHYLLRVDLECQPATIRRALVSQGILQVIISTTVGNTSLAARCLFTLLEYGEISCIDIYIYVCLFSTDDIGNFLSTNSMMSIMEIIDGGPRDKPILHLIHVLSGRRMHTP